MARATEARLMSRRSLVADAMLMPFLLSGCGAYPDSAVISEAEAGRESALSMVRSYLVKYGEHSYGADILSSEPYCFFGGKGGKEHCDGRWIMTRRHGNELSEFTMLSDEPELIFLSWGDGKPIAHEKLGYSGCRIVEIEVESRKAHVLYAASGDTPEYRYGGMEHMDRPTRKRVF